MPGAAVYAGAIDNWGYPKGGSRRIRPTILLVVHITDNHNLMDAAHEAAYVASNDHSSWTFCNNRDGTRLQLLDPVTQTPWTNGDGNAPNMALSTVAHVFDGNPYNANEFCFMTAENVGSEAVGAPITAAQVEALAQEAAWGATLYEQVYGVAIPITRETVLGHRDFNSVTRHGCPTAGDLEALLGRIISRANEILQSDDAMNARPATYHETTGATISIDAGKTYNAFQYLGLDAAGKPILRRFNGVVYGSNTSADVQGFAHWEADKPMSECYMVSPWVFLPGIGWRDDVWWSRTPNPPPAYSPPPAPATVDTSALEDKIASLSQQVTDLTAERDAANRTAAAATKEAGRVKGTVTEYLNAEAALHDLAS